MSFRMKTASRPDDFLPGGSELNDQMNTERRLSCGTQISLSGDSLRAVNHDLRRSYFLGKNLKQITFPAVPDRIPN